MPRRQQDARLKMSLQQKHQQINAQSNQTIQTKSLNEMVGNGISLSRGKKMRHI